MESCYHMIRYCNAPHRMSRRGFLNGASVLEELSVFPPKQLGIPVSSFLDVQRGQNTLIFESSGI